MTHSSKRLFGAAILAASCLMAPLAATAKPATTHMGPTGPMSLTGMWVLEAKDFGANNALPLTAQGQAFRDDERKSIAAGNVIFDSQKKCLPDGVPSIMASEFAMEILETPDRVTIVKEESPLVRSVYLDEKKHTEGLEPMWNGHSIGHWEGATLVVDTVNFNDKARPLGFIGVHSPTTHMIERFHVDKGGKALTVTFTFEDPTYLTKPWTGAIHYRRLPPHSELWEYACEVGAEGWSERFKGDPAAKPAPAH